MTRSRFDPDRPLGRIAGMAELDRLKVQIPDLGRPHLVVVGAGASYAAFPNGDKHGRRLPLMLNIVDVLGLRPLLDAAGVPYNGENFETLYSTLVAGGHHGALVSAFEKAILDYFGGLELPDEPTLYDHLIFSLRRKDVIATFNWDPFLVQAYARCYAKQEGPRLLFLHGNAAIGTCFRHEPPTFGRRGRRCGTCGETFADSRLLYPVAEKNYDSDPAIKLQWDVLRQVLQHAYILTIFGYGAPASDVEAITLMKSAWGPVEKREFEETEIIDIKPEDELAQTWSPFIHTHHYRVATNFYDSLIAHSPRRSCEAMRQQLMEAQFNHSNPLPKNAGWDQLRAFYDTLLDDEVEYSKQHK